MASLVGVLLTCLAALAGRPVAFYLAILCAMIGALMVSSAITVGPRRPKIAATLYLGSVLLPLSIGAAAAALGIWATSVIAGWKGPDAAPFAEALAGATTGVIAQLVERANVLSSLMPPSLAEWGTTKSYQRCFPKLSLTPPDPPDPPAFKLAYQAIHLPKLTDDAGPILGWGYSATHRRLALIAGGIAVLDPKSPCART